MKEESTINYAFALKNYQQNGRGRSMAQFCEELAKHNAFMYSIIESCKMMKRNVEDYLKALFHRLRTVKNGEDLTCCLPCSCPFSRELKNQKNINKTTDNQW